MRRLSVLFFLFVTQSLAQNSCLPCHQQIVSSYAQTPMAHASGPAADDLLPADITKHNVHYTVSTQNEKPTLAIATSDLHEVRELLYFIGSGRRGRTYLFATDNFFFEAPINYYGQQKLWDLTPAYQNAPTIPLNLPVTQNCLACHTSDSHAPAPGTENKFAMPLFAHNGISCERCHGPSAAHAQNPQSGAIINPRKLAPAKRDAVCMQCHFEGQVAIQQPGRNVANFQPGESLSDFIHYYVLSNPGTPPNAKLGALSQTEALAQSVCKLKSGNAMFCTSCHDPHSVPAPEQKVAYYRAKCLSCHGEDFARHHHKKEPDCRSCHMPPVGTADIAHTQATDHRILRDPHNPPMPPPSTNSTPQLIRFPYDSPTQNARDLGLAWSSLAQQNFPNASREAARWLAKAARENPNDPAILTALAYQQQTHAQLDSARQNYERALQLDPLNNEAALDLAVLEAQSSHVDRAIALLQGPFERIPYRPEVAQNLAQLYCSANQPEKAAATLRRLLQFTPDNPQAQAILRQLTASHTCPSM